MRSWKSGGRLFVCFALLVSCGESNPNHSEVTPGEGGQSSAEGESLGDGEGELESGDSTTASAEVGEGEVGDASSEAGATMEVDSSSGDEALETEATEEDSTETNSEGADEASMTGDDEVGDVDPDEVFADLRIEAVEEMPILSRIHWRQLRDSTATRVSFRLPGEGWLHSPALPCVAGEHSELIIGIPAEHEFEYRLEAMVPEGVSRTPRADFRTGTKFGPPVAEVQVYDEAGAHPVRWMATTLTSNRGSSGGPSFRVVFDRKARVVWASSTGHGLFASTTMRRSPDSGLLAFDEYQRMAGPSADNFVLRTTLDHSKSTKFSTPYARTNFDFSSEDSVVYFAEIPTESTADRMILMESSIGGAQREIWDCRAWASELDPQPDINVGCRGYGIHYNQGRDTVFVDLLTDRAVIEVDRGSGEVQRHWGRLPGAEIQVPESADIGNFASASYADDGDLFFASKGGDGLLWLQEFVHDTNQGNWMEVWRSSVDLYPSTGGYHGMIQVLGPDNYLANGDHSEYLVEVARNGDTVWQIKWGYGDGSTDNPLVVGHGFAIDDLYALRYTPSQLARAEVWVE